MQFQTLLKMKTTDCTTFNELKLNRSVLTVGLPADIAKAIPADGGARGTKHSGDHIRQKESSACLLPVMAQVQNPPDRWNGRCKSLYLPPSSLP